jgi:hypothetical protein
MNEPTHSSEWCEMVFDGNDANGDVWNRCTVHGYLVFGDAYVCEGYEPPKMRISPPTCTAELDEQGRHVEIVKGES